MLPYHPQESRTKCQDFDPQQSQDQPILSAAGYDDGTKNLREQSVPPADCEAAHCEQPGATSPKICIVSFLPRLPYVKKVKII